LSLRRQFILSGDIITLRCEVVRGNPKNYSFMWKFMDTAIGNNTTVDNNSSTLTIENFAEADSGIYNCSAMNHVGTGKGSVIVNYEGNKKSNIQIL